MDAEDEAEGAGSGQNNKVSSLSIESLKLVRTHFDRAEMDGNDGLVCDEFIAAFLSLQTGLFTQENLEHLFMKIDANSDGCVDWTEFSNFMLLESRGRGQMWEDHVSSEIVPSEIRQTPKYVAT